MLKASNPPETITVVGNDGIVYDYNTIKSAVVAIGGNYYFRHDTANVVLVKDDEGKLRFYRTNSPLICLDSDGQTILKKQAFLTPEGIYHNKKSKNIVKIGDSFFRKEYCIAINNDWYLRTDPAIVKIYDENGFILKKDAVLLSRKYYPKTERYLRTDNQRTVLLLDGELILKGDATEIYNPELDRFEYYYSMDNRLKNLAQILYDFQDKTNPQEDRLVYKKALATSVFNGNDLNTNWFNTLMLAPGHSLHVIPKNKEAYFQKIIKEVITPRYESKLDKIVKMLNSQYSDCDETENVAKVFKHIPKPFAGKQELYRSTLFSKPIKSKVFSKTGGLEYSFGLELETSDGLLHSEHVEELGLFCVGDRSVGAGEYVTPPMMGNDGIEHLELVCDMLNKTTLVDDRCGVHVHVGSLFTKTDKHPTPSKIQSPSFSKQFLINSINLGALLEEELFKSLPQNRKPTLYHCHSIKRFKGINTTNFDTYLGAYIFGPKEWWLDPTENCPYKLFNFADYKLNANRNSDSQLGTWADGRYKWLNLIPSYTRSPHRTIEFRIFSGTTNFKKVRMYLLTSMAFTYFADNCTKDIVDGITLSQVFETSFAGHDDLIAELNLFYKERTALFNRKNIYPALNLPFLK